jgi:ferredoxin
MAQQKPDRARLASVDFTPPRTAWRRLPADFRKGTYNYAAPRKHVEALGLPNPREWQPHDADWKLPADWKQIILDGMKERLQKYRSFRLFMDTCVRCGACADKCHFYLGSGDPRNTPVLRAELLRSVYRRYFTPAGRALGPLAGARDLT